MEIKTHIKNVIDATFKVLQDVYENQREGGNSRNGEPQSRIIFPLKRKKRQHTYLRTRVAFCICRTII